MRLGLGLDLEAASSEQGGGGSLASLFANGEDGFLFYPMSDLTRLFLLSTGSTGNVAVDGDLVGLDLDDHSWAGNTLAQVLAAQSELVTNGDFSLDASWTKSDGSVTITGGALVFAASTAFQNGQQAVALTAGKTYRVQYDIVAYASGGVRAAFAGGTQVSGTTRTALGTYVEYLVAVAGNTNLFLQAGASGFSGSLDNVSVKLVPGNHALQATTTKRPAWKANSGKPYLLFDGTDDSLVSPFLPTAAMTIACAFSSPTASAILIGGGDSASSHRAFLSLDASGKLSGGWGAQSLTTILGGADIRSANHVGLLTADGTSVDLYLDGVQIYSASPSGSPSGGTGGMSLGAFNNAGTPASFSNASMFAGLTMDRRATVFEIALITRKFQGAYQ